MDTQITTFGCNTPAVKAPMFPVVQAKLIRHSPEILVGVGVIGVLGATFLACRATLKAPVVVYDHQEKIDIINDRYADADENELNAKDRRKELVKVYSVTAVEFGKLYAVPAALMAASIFSITKGHGITMQRNAGLTAALGSVTTAYKAYRDRVAEVYGEETEDDIYNGRAMEVAVKDPKTGKIKEKKVDEVAVPSQHSAYARCFDEASPHWQPSPELNKTFLLCHQNYANDMLNVKGHIFLNEVYDMLGIPRTAAGNVVGWVKENGDGYVDFGIFNAQNESIRRFVNGDEPSIWLDFNVDGKILQLI